MDEPLVLLVNLKGTPHALPRGRHIPGRRRPVSLTGKAKVYADALQRAARAAVLQVGADEVERAFAGRALSVSILWRFPTRFAGKLGTPHDQKPDRDNLEKLDLDCLQRAGALGGDDCRGGDGRHAKNLVAAGIGGNSD